MRELIKPEKVKVEEETFSKTYGKFIIEPLEKGYGITLGNSLRRILLSSIPGAAAISVKIDGVDHEFATIPGVKEDVLQIIQNIKKIRVKLYTDKEKEVFLDVRGPLKVKASHIQTDSDVEIVNPDLYLATLDNEKVHLSMQITLAKGRGYVEASENKRENQPVRTIPIDSIFSPINKVKYEVHPARIGRKTSFDSLVLEILTDGTIPPDEALNEAAKILRDYTTLFVAKKGEEEIKKGEKSFLEEEVEKIGLSNLALNALKDAKIIKIKDLLDKNSKELLKIHNFGKKSLEKVKKELAQHNLSIKEEKK
ncbi:DNA-directed RNA polymerase subunit alpha [Candidatus Aerophobetes bacterium]|nr:DNA-directed RNA polymerase subunit alpha [Candidatus Aerophobetes bacterium]